VESVDTFLEWAVDVDLGDMDFGETASMVKLGWRGKPKAMSGDVESFVECGIIQESSLR